MKKKSFIIHQKITEKQGNGESYGKWVFDNQRGDEGIEGPENEDRLANPDGCNESGRMYSNSQMTNAQALMGHAVEHLQGRQREVYLLTMRQGLSIAKAAAQLDITKSSAQVYRTRAINFVSKYCKDAIKNGSL
jgi:DNA-directed RNA polymerase specialized sigma24 family protein